MINQDGAMEYIRAFAILGGGLGALYLAQFSRFFWRRRHLRKAVLPGRDVRESVQTRLEINAEQVLRKHGITKKALVAMSQQEFEKVKEILASEARKLSTGRNRKARRANAKRR